MRIAMHIVLQNLPKRTGTSSPKKWSGFSTRWISSRKLSKRPA